MGFFRREPTIGNSNLTQSDLNRLLDLDDTYRTDYTYVMSKSYRPDGSDIYENPRMSRLPLSYYRRKWAFERARKAGLIYYTYFRFCDFFTRLFANCKSLIFTLAAGVFCFIIRVLWCVVNSIFPNPEGFATEPRVIGSQHQKTTRGNDSARNENVRQCEGRSEFWPSVKSDQVGLWRAEVVPSHLLSSKLGQFLTSVVTLGLCPSDNAQRQRVKGRYNEDCYEESDIDDYGEQKWQGRFSFNPRCSLSRNVRRRVRTSSYEYSENREPECSSQSNVLLKPSERIVESLIYKIFLIASMILLLPVKIFQFTTEKIAWILGLSNRAYDSSRIVHKKPFEEQSLKYSGRIVNFLTKAATSCAVNVFFWAANMLRFPLTIFSYIAAGMLDLMQLLQCAIGTASRKSYMLGGLHEFVIKVVRPFVIGFLSLIDVIQTVPLDVAENVRKRIAYALAYTLGPKSAKLVGFEEKSLAGSRKKIVSNRHSLAAGQGIRTYNKRTRICSELFPTERSVKYCSVFWKWLFPLLLLLLLVSAFSSGHDSEDISIVNTVATLPFKIQKTLFNGWANTFSHYSKNLMSSFSYVLALPIRSLYSLSYYPAKLLKYPHEAVDKVIHLFNDVYTIGRSIAEKANNSFLREVASMLHDTGSFLYGNSCEKGKSIVNSTFGILEFFYEIVGRIFGSMSGIFSLAGGLICDVGKLLLALPSYFISKTVELIPFLHRQTGNVKWDFSDDDSSSDHYTRGKVEWNLDSLKHEKELLESEISQLRREHEFEKNKYRDIHEAVRLVEEMPLSQAQLATHNRLLKSVMVNEELLQHKIEKDFRDYVATFKRTEDNELIKELAELSHAIETLRSDVDKLRQEKEVESAEFIHAIMSRETEQNDDLNNLKIELNNKIKDDLEKKLSSSLSHFQKVTQEEREAFYLEIMKMVEFRVASLFANHLAERSNDNTETKVGLISGLSESDLLYIKKMITDALDTYDADKTGKVDYALESSGASIVSTRCTEPYKENSRLESIFGIPLWYSSYSPRAVIQHRPLAAGECWAFRGKGYLTIKLSHPVYVTEVSYEHLHSTLHPEGILKSAPRLFQVYSYLASDDQKSKTLIGEYEYDIAGRALQSFPVQNNLHTPTSIIELVIQSNWDAEYTCLYRFRVHGQKA